MAFSPALLAPITPFAWRRLWVSDDAPLSFMLEIAFRCVVMFVLTVAALRISGKRGVRQLSLFEFALLLVLGSAAGDATIYHDTPLLHAAVVFVVIIAMYVLLNYFTDKYPRIERLLEGEAELIIVEGEIDLPAFSKSSLTGQELFDGIEHGLSVGVEPGARVVRRSHASRIPPGDRRRPWFHCSGVTRAARCHRDGTTGRSAWKTPFPSYGEAHHLSVHGWWPFTHRPL